MVYVYVLRLENEKYYVGRTNNLEERIKEHVEGMGSEWTTLHKPLEVVETVELCDPTMEDVVTKKYVDLYGTANVRGGSYCQIKPPKLKLPARKKK